MNIDELYPRYEMSEDKTLYFITPENVISLSLFLLNRSYMADNEKCFRIEHVDTPLASDIVLSDSALMLISLYLLLNDSKKTLSTLKRIHFIIGMACGDTPGISEPAGHPEKPLALVGLTWFHRFEW